MLVNTRSPWSMTSMLLLLASLFAVLPAVAADDSKIIKGYDFNGAIQKLDIAPQPSLYSGGFADCLRGGSLFNFSTFDVAYYTNKSHHTIFFHLDGASNIRKESLVLHLSIQAYGQARFDMSYDPCKAHMDSLCPLTSDKRISAFAVVPLSSDDVAGMPEVTMGIPDFEGFARMQIFANSTQTEIGCFQTVMSNGKTLSQPEAIGTTVGVFVIATMLSSFITAAYGISVPHMRMHYAHSFSVLIVFETFQYIFFSGALSVNWPSVLPAWWSNFAWPSGMFATHSLVRSISSFTGNVVSVTQVGGAGSVPINNNGGLTQQIYGRADPATGEQPSPVTDLDGYAWGGEPNPPGMPMPGTWPGLPGTLSEVYIPPAEAFTLALIWFMAMIGLVAVLIVLFKLTLDVLIRFKLLRTDGFNYFRSHLGGYLAAALLRTCFIGFFVMTTLAMYQFSLRGPDGPTAIAAIVFLLFLVGVGSIAAYACYFRLRHGKYSTAPDSIRFESAKLFKKVPFVSAIRNSERGEEETAEQRRLYASVPITRIVYTDDNPNRPTVHQDAGFIKRFGWLSGRYRRTRWWYFAVYLGYQFIRACFIGGGARTPLAQVFGLFLFEIIASIIIIKLTAFEGSRNTVVAVWIISIAKILTTGLSIAFIADYNVNRIGATAIGLIIVVVQAFLAIVVLVLAALGIMSSWMSLSRNKEEFTEPFVDMRVKYFEHMQKRTDDLPTPPKEDEMEATAPEPGFNVRNVRRAPKIEDEDELAEISPPQPGFAGQAGGSGQRSRANSGSSRYSASSIPRAARVHRASWSSKEFSQMQAEMMTRPEIQRGTHSRSNSQRMSSASIAAVMGTDSPGSSTPVRRPMTPTRESSEDARDISETTTSQTTPTKRSDEEMPEEKTEKPAPVQKTEQQVAVEDTTVSEAVADKTRDEKAAL
ncbi:TRP-like ion channel [Cordyceps fumosorosea ARSEF 2679]|uniref:TRP-like ion channel n=1 Tax=Cordyceps fumosorosea (strain ARSEF 2679) TaxID=1081104 RepID=A0A167SXZ9_CORFA|nr:TRP-like ion channel [Cordyceps fumosorosea ARSEF 2679]OAA60049.1 TRP-like ion channel [Cordyceps fumosorosea ARSEF 2679]